MSQIRLVADSSCDLLSLDGVDFVSVPLTLRTETEEFRDDARLDVDAMVATLRATKGRSYSACPNVADWEKAFGESGDVLAFTITSSLSGSYSGGVLGFSVNAAVTEDITVQGGSVTGADFVSSIVGNCNGAKIRRCVSNMDVVRLPSNQDSPRYGGIAPVITRDTAVVEDCLYYGTIRLYGNEIAGGIVGNPTAGQIRRCQFAGQVLHQASSSSTAIIGGITGKQEKGGVHDCQSSGIISSYLGTTIGGITRSPTPPPKSPATSSPAP